MQVQKLLRNLQKKIQSKDSKTTNNSDNNNNNMNNTGKKINNTNNKNNINNMNKTKTLLNSKKKFLGNKVFKKKVKLEDFSEELSSFRDVTSVDERKQLFIKKLHLCCYLFDFTNNISSNNDNINDLNNNNSNSSSNTNNNNNNNIINSSNKLIDQKIEMAKELKRRYLLELVDYISQSKHWFSEDVMSPILLMISSNIFRSLPPPIYADFDPEEDEPNFDPSWPHLQYVYEFFHRFVMHCDVKLIRKSVDKRFLISLIELFDSEDPRERDYLKTILHRIYGRCMPFRSFVRKCLNNVLYPIIYENGRHNGLSEILEILGSIINGFALPLKEEHVTFLRNVLIPMHKVNTLSQFHQQLAYCITQFIQKTPQLASIVVGGMLKFWPATSCQKEILFLNELEEVLELTGNQQLEKIIEPLFKRIGLAICSNHFQVAERALFLWNNDIIATFTSDHRAIILPIIYPALQKNYSKHWNSTVSSLTLNIIRIFKEMDKDLYDQVSKKYKNNKIDPQEKEKIRKEKWSKLKLIYNKKN